MITSPFPWATASQQNASSASDQAQLSDRGTLTVPTAVIAKIAAQVASEVDVVGAASGGVLGLGARRNFENRPKADAQLFGNTAVLSLDVGIAYPTPLRTAAEQIRTYVGHRVNQLTGFDVEQIDVEISWLHPATSVTTRGALQ